MTPTLAQLVDDPVNLGRYDDPSLLQVISPYMAVFFVAFFVAFIATPIMRRLALANGIVDWPDLKRKNHIQPVAYLGGVAIFLGWLVGIAVTFVAQPDTERYLEPQLALVGFPLSIVLGAAAITLTGLFDDVYGISPRVKVGGQLFAAAALATEDVGIRLIVSAGSLIGVDLPEPVAYVLGTFVIAAFVIGGCNAVNLIDGLDGLASGVTAIAAAGFLIMAAIIAVRPESSDLIHSHTDGIRIVMCLAILGALLGFLPFNFNPATIFMGDAGSLLLGYLSVTTILLFTLASGQPLLLITAALIVFALPITDTSLAIFRRKMAGQPIFSADNRHIHHLLRRYGFTVRQSVLILYTAAILFAALGVTMVALELRWRYILAVFVVMYCFIMVTAYKYGQHQAILDKRREEREQAALAAEAVASGNGNGHPGNGAHTPPKPTPSTRHSTDA
jgi:UDP-GlcNAc:undecaprenyl-phosphate GlcNAc-1-phosphate transferase